MNEKLTREVLEDMAMCGEISCSDCKGFCKCTTFTTGFKTFATALLAEMDKPKVWDGAPNDAVECHIVYRRRNDSGEDLKTFKTYTRHSRKSRTRIMAEEIASAHISNKDDLIDIIEQTINAHMEELKGEA